MVTHPAPSLVHSHATHSVYHKLPSPGLRYEEVAHRPLIARTYPTWQALAAYERVYSDVEGISNHGELVVCR
jgi:hypothetical protein